MAGAAASGKDVAALDHRPVERAAADRVTGPGGLLTGHHTLPPGLSVLSRADYVRPSLPQLRNSSQTGADRHRTHTPVLSGRVNPKWPRCRAGHAAAARTRPPW